MIIDTHAHLGDSRLDWFLNSDLNNNLVTISIGCTIKEIERSKTIAEKLSNVFFTAGAYPFYSIEDNQNYSDLEILNNIEQYLSHPKCVAIGECGFDFSSPSGYERSRTPEEQTDLLYRQLLLGEKYNKPIVLHIRNATDFALHYISVNKRYFQKSVWHCFTEDLKVATKVLDLGLMISLTGIITYKSGEAVRDAIKYIPIDRLLLETDSPYLVPDELRKHGEKINNPSYVKIVADTISKIKGLNYDKVVEQTTSNANSFFNLGLKI